MQKFIRIMAIIATILVVFSLLLLLVTIPFQRMICKGIFGASDDMLSFLPIFPLQSFLFALVRLGLLILLVIMAGKTRSIWAEVLVFGMLALVLPGVSRVVSPMYSMMIHRLYGSAYIAAHNMVNNIINYCSIPGSLGISLAYVTCGMSIAYKSMNKKSVKAVE